MSDTTFKDFEDAPAAPTLVFGSGADAPAAAGAQQAPAQKPKGITAEEAVLTPEELRQVEAFARQIDISNTSAILSYGVGTQKKLADFSEKAIDNIRTKDMGEVGEMLTGLVTQLQDFGEEEEDDKGLFGFFKKKTKKVEELKVRYASVEANVQTVADELERHQVTLLKDADLMDRMYALNLAYYKELSMYVLAGKKKLEEARTVDLVRLQQKAAQSGLPEDAQAAQDFAAQCDRFEKKLYDLELTRTIAMQTAPQIRMVQNSDIIMAEKIQSTIVNTIPLWKNQMVITMGLEHATQAAAVEKQVSDMTNELLKKNAAALKQATVETAKASERGIVDIETLKQTNETLISAMDEVITIQTEGKQKRREAQAELQEIENQLKEKLLQAAQS